MLGDVGLRGRENTGMCRALPSWPGYAVMAMVPCAVRWPVFNCRNLLEDGGSRKGLRPAQHTTPISSPPKTLACLGAGCGTARRACGGEAVGD